MPRYTWGRTEQWEVLVKRDGKTIKSMNTSDIAAKHLCEILNAEHDVWMQENNVAAPDESVTIYFLWDKNRTELTVEEYFGTMPRFIQFKNNDSRASVTYGHEFCESSRYVFAADKKEVAESFKLDDEEVVELTLPKSRIVRLGRHETALGQDLWFIYVRFFNFIANHDMNPQHHPE